MDKQGNVDQRHNDERGDLHLERNYHETHIGHSGTR
jgi:hypothetical protein